MSLRIVAISDTHGNHWGLKVPDGDILIHAGDMTVRGSIEDVKDFDAFLGQLPHPVKIAIAGKYLSKNKYQNMKFHPSEMFKVLGVETRVKIIELLKSDSKKVFSFL